MLNSHSTALNEHGMASQERASLREPIPYPVPYPFAYCASCGGAIYEGERMVITCIGKKECDYHEGCISIDEGIAGK